jgi:RimJ/RimL family protein N-acetyltransferase
MGLITKLRAMNLADGLGLRSARAADGAFMEELFRSTRGHLYALPILRQQIDHLVAQQYQLQQTSYAGRWPDAQTMIIECSGQAIGKITLDEDETALHIVDFIVAPAMRGKGYGTAVLKALQTAAGRRRISLSVDRQNSVARKLYLHLGFQVESASETHESMSWAPSTVAVSGECIREFFINITT